MPTYQRAPKQVEDIANEIIKRYKTHAPLIEAGVTIDYVFALPELDDNGQPVEDAIKKDGVKALGQCRKIPLKDRAMGRADAEIMIDGYWWEHVASAEAQEAVLDHELHHIAVQEGKVDDLRRPKLKLRKHDWQFGWFNIIAERHGKHSMEVAQAKQITDMSGQLYWPHLIGNGPKEIKPAKAK